MSKEIRKFILIGDRIQNRSEVPFLSRDGKISGDDITVIEKTNKIYRKPLEFSHRNAIVIFILTISKEIKLYFKILFDCSSELFIPMKMSFLWTTVFTISPRYKSKSTEKFVENSGRYIFHKRNYLFKPFTNTFSISFKNIRNNFFGIYNCLIKSINAYSSKLYKNNYICLRKKALLKNSLRIRSILLSFFVITITLSLFFLLPKVIHSNNETKSEWNNNNWDELEFE